MLLKHFTGLVSSSKQHVQSAFRQALRAPNTTLFPYRACFSSSIILNQAVDEKVQLQQHIGIANDFIKTNNINGALENYRKALEILQSISLDKIFSSTDTITMAEIHLRKGTIFFSNGDLEDALKNFQRARDLFEGSLDQGLMVAECDDNIGSILFELGNHADALNSFENALGFYSETFNDISMAKVFYKMSMAYAALGQKDVAVDKMKKSIEIRETLGLMEDEEASDVLMIFGEALVNNGEYTKAVEVLSQALKIKADLFDEEHPDLIHCYSSLAGAYNLSMMTEKALEFFFKSQDLKKKIFGKASVELVEDYINIADIYCNEGDFDKALTNYKQALKISNKNRKTSTTLSYIHYKMGAIYLELKYMSEAISSLEEGLKARMKASKMTVDERPNIFEFYEMLANAYFELQNYEQAKQYYYEALKYCLRTPGNRSSEAFQINLALGSINCLLNNYDEAMVSFENALQNQNQADGSDSSGLGYVHHGFANVYYKQMKLSQAIEHYKKANELLTAELTGNNIYFANLCSDFAAALKENGEIEEAIQTLNKGMDVVIQNYGVAHPDVSEFFKDLKSLYDKKGDYEQIYKLSNFLRM